MLHLSYMTRFIICNKLYLVHSLYYSLARNLLSHLLKLANYLVYVNFNID